MLQQKTEQLPHLHRMHKPVRCRQLALQRLRYRLLSLYISRTPLCKDLLEAFDDLQAPRYHAEASLSGSRRKAV